MGTDPLTDYLFFYLAALLLAVLKLAGFIAIGWGWVASPVVVALILLIISYLIEWRS